MKAEKRSVAEIAHAYPVGGRLDGWFFRRRETSNGAYTVEGTDLWGRTVSRQGGDPDQLHKQCIEDARHIQSDVDGSG